MISIFPKRKFTVFAGENSWKDIWVGLRHFFSLREDARDILAFEDAFSNFVNRTHSVSFGSGRMALYAILKSLGIGPGDEVVIQAFTCNVVPRAIRAIGAKPVYADIDPVTLNMDPESLKSVVTEQTRVVVVQHTFGMPPDMSLINKILGARKDIVVVEDCAHSFKPLAADATLDGRGFAFFSTDHTKPLNTHVGGVACCQSEKDVKLLRQVQKSAKQLSFFRRKQLQLSFLVEAIGHRPSIYPVLRYLLALIAKLDFMFSWPDNHSIADDSGRGGIYGMTPFQARLGIEQLRKADSNMRHRCEAFRALENRFRHYGTEQALPLLRYPVVVEDRRAFYSSLRSELPQSTWFDAPVSGGAAVYEDVLYDLGSCPIAERVSENVVNVSISGKTPLDVCLDPMRTQNADWDKTAGVSAE
jgi:perosamine synthetase